MTRHPSTARRISCDRARSGVASRSLVSIVLLALAVLGPAVASAQERPRVLVITSGAMPGQLRSSVTQLIASRAALASTDDYERAAARRNLRPTSDRALTRIATQQNVSVIVVASYGGHFRRRVLRVRFLDGRTGELRVTSTHTLRGMRLRPASQHAILRDIATIASGGDPTVGRAPDEEEPEAGEETEEAEATEARAEPSAETTEASGDLPPPLDWGAEAPASEAPADEPIPEAPAEEQPATEEEPAAPAAIEEGQWGFAATIGFGIMQRSASIPMEAGEARLSTVPFPAIQAELLGYVRPDASSRFRLALDIRYTSSVGLQAQDQRSDGTTRTTDMRIHHLMIGLDTRIPLAPGAKPTYLTLGAGWGFRMMDAEMPVSIPDYTLSGPYARVGLFFPIGDSPLAIGIIPEVGHMSSLSTELSQQGALSDGVLVGAEAHIVLEIIRELVVELIYRESHALLGGQRGGMSDAERYGILRGSYRF